MSAKDRTDKVRLSIANEKNIDPILILYEDWQRIQSGEVVELEVEKPPS